MKKYLDDALVVIGAGFLLYATYQVNLIAFWYLLGILLIIAGVVIGASSRNVRLPGKGDPGKGDQ